MKDNPAELLPIVDINGVVIGKANRKVCHSNSFLLHPVVHLHVFNSLGQLYLQKRPKWKTVQPGKWDTAVGGHVDYGESIDVALSRETIEELGIETDNNIKIKDYIFTSKNEKELVYSFYCIYDKKIMPSQETDGGLFWNINDIESRIGTNTFTKNFETEYFELKLSEISKKITNHIIKDK